MEVMLVLQRAPAPRHEFVSGPLNAGTCGPSDLDVTFGPQVRYFKAPPEG